MSTLTLTDQELIYQSYENENINIKITSVLFFGFIKNRPR